MSEQSDFWAGTFGDEYVARNASDQLLASNLSFFSQVILAMGSKPTSVFELGTNIGMNLDAINLLCPETQLGGIEVNPGAAEIGRSKGYDIEVATIESFSSTDTFSLVFSKGVLIHLNPDSLPRAYELLADLSQRFVLIAEYFSPSPTEVSYRGHSNKLFKRDFATEFLGANANFELRHSGFLSSLDPFPQDNINWYLFEKTLS